MSAQTCPAASARTATTDHATTDHATTDRTVTDRPVGVTLDLPERGPSLARLLAVVGVALLSVLLAATLVVALAGTALGTLLLVAGLLAAPFALFAYVVAGAGAVAETLATARN